MRGSGRVGQLQLLQLLQVFVSEGQQLLVALLHWTLLLEHTHRHTCTPTHKRTHTHAKSQVVHGKLHIAAFALNIDSQNRRVSIMNHIYKRIIRQVFLSVNVNHAF